MRRAVFLDRDGVVVEQVDGYLTRPDELRLLPGVARAIKRLREAGFVVVMVTNQAGIGYGRLSEEALSEVHRRLEAELALEEAGVDAIYYCPHTPEEGCPCRKPAPGMLERAAEDLGIDLSHSYMVGDMTTDIEAGKRAGCFAILVRTGFGGADGRSGEVPDAVCDDLPQAVDYILRREGLA